MKNQEIAQTKKFFVSKWIKRFGVAGFLFFLIKGLLWLLVPVLIGYFVW